MTDHHIAFWNVENLFGPENHPHRIDWIKSKVQSDLRGWTDDIYRTKLRQLARIIALMNGNKGPDILGLCEVEDAFVLQDLLAEVKALLPERDYGIVHTDSAKEKRGVDSAFLFDVALYDAPSELMFSHVVLRRTGTRDILQQTFRTRAHGHDLVILANHWPARSGEARQSAGFRATAGETLAYWHSRIWEEARDGKETAVLAMGDFNDEPFDDSVRFNAISWRERGDVERGTSPKFLNLAWEYLRTWAVDHRGDGRWIDGSYYYRDTGQLFDQLMINRNLVKGDARPFSYVDHSAGVFTPPEMVSHDKGYGAIRFGLPKGKPDRVNTGGFSDHFPVYLTLRERAGTAA